MNNKRLQLGALIVIISSVAPGIAQTGKAQQVDPRASQTSAANSQRGTQSIKGRILGDGGRPIADASIMLFPLNIGSNPQAAITSLLRPIASDADGKRTERADQFDNLFHLQ